MRGGPEAFSQSQPRHTQVLSTHLLVLVRIIYKKTPPIFFLREFLDTTVATADKLFYGFLQGWVGMSVEG